MFYVIDVEEWSDVDAATNNWTTVTSGPDTSPRELLRAAPLLDQRPDCLEAIVVADPAKRQLG